MVYLKKNLFFSSFYSSIGHIFLSLTLLAICKTILNIKSGVYVFTNYFVSFSHLTRQNLLNAWREFGRYALKVFHNSINMDDFWSSYWVEQGAIINKSFKLPRKNLEFFKNKLQVSLPCFLFFFSYFSLFCVN